MKKKLILILTLVLVLALIASVMVACDFIGNIFDSDDGGDDSGNIDGGGSTDGDGSGDTDGDDNQQPEIPEPVALQYQLAQDEQSYIVVGIGTLTGTAIEIPDTYSDLPVTSIGKEAFSNCTNLQSVIIANTVLSIGENAFSECINLQSITMPSSLRSIGNNAFV